MSSVDTREVSLIATVLLEAQPWNSLEFYTGKTKSNNNLTGILNLTILQHKKLKASKISINLIERQDRSNGHGLLSKLTITTSISKRSEGHIGLSYNSLFCCSISFLLFILLLINLWRIWKSRVHIAWFRIERSGCSEGCKRCT